MSPWNEIIDDNGLSAAWQELAGHAAQQAAQNKPWLLQLLNECGAACGRVLPLAARYALWKGRLGCMRPGDRRRLQRRLGVGLAGAALLLALTASPGGAAPAAAITVTNGTSTVANGDGCSLPEAITNANADNTSGSIDCVAGSGADTITITVPVGLTAALPTITTTITIEGGGNTISRSSGSFRILDVGAGGNLTLNSATVSGGQSSGGAGIYAAGTALLTVTNSVLTGNSSSSTGGAIRGLSATIVVSNSTLSANTATVLGGGIFAVFGSLSVSNSTISGNTTTQAGGGKGGGIAAVSTTVAISRSTLSGNRNTGGGAAGGGVYAGFTTLTVATSTLSGNSSATGGALNSYNSTVAVLNSTLTNNSASSSGLGFGGGIWSSGGAVTVTNSIVAAQTSGNDCAVTTPTSGGHNIESGTSCGFAGTGDQASTNPLLAALANNGGPTLTHLPQKNSPALDRGSCAAGTDQRSLTRPVDLGDAFYPNGVGGSCDVGAVEVQSITANAVSLQDFAAVRGAGGGLAALWAGFLAAGAGLAVVWRRRRRPGGERSLLAAPRHAGGQAAPVSEPIAMGLVYQPPAIVGRSYLKHFSGSPLAVDPFNLSGLPQ